MNVTVIGTGYVGLVTGACLADAGNSVFCLDVDERKIRLLNAGQDPDLRARPGSHRRSGTSDAGRLQFSTDVAASVAHGELQIIAVGTPPGEDGSADLQHVVAAARSIGRHDERVQGRRHQVDRAGGHRRQGARSPSSRS